MSDDSFSTSSEETEPEPIEEEEEDYAAQVARRMQEERRWQAVNHDEEVKVKEVHKNPYEMLPARYRVGEVGETEVKQQQQQQPPQRGGSKTLLVTPSDDQRPSQKEEETDSDTDHDSPPSTEPDLPDVDAFNPRMLADMIQTDYKEPTDPTSDMFELATSVLEEVIESDPHFDHLQERFKSKHCHIFTDDEEHKLEYYTAFQQWVKKLDAYLTKKLSAVPSFEITEYIAIMEDRKDELSPELWNLILSFTDYQVFKDAMLDYKTNGPTTDPEQREELLSAIQTGEDLMNRHIKEAYEAKEAQLADDAVQRGLEKLYMPAEE